MPRALLSVSDKNGIVDLGRGLAARGFELVSTGGTAQTLTNAGLRVTKIAEVTGFPEMMDGRLKTLHPNIHGGILARRAIAADIHAITRLGIQPIDVVVVNLYPFAQTAAKPGVTFDELVEQIDIGGPSMVRAAAKNFRDVLVVVDPRRYRDVLTELDRTGGPSLAFRFALAREAIQHTGRYDVEIASMLKTFDVEGSRIVPGATQAALPEAVAFDVVKLRDLRYGENPHQKAALYTGFTPHFTPRNVLQGKELSFTNLLDLDAAVRIVLEFPEPAAVVVKHTNPCGAAIGSTAVDAYVCAREADSLAAFGGIVALNRSIDVSAAEALTATFIEVVIAPAVEESARPLLGKKANMRVVTADYEALAACSREQADVELRSTLAGMLVQS